MRNGLGEIWIVSVVSLVLLAGGTAFQTISPLRWIRPKNYAFHRASREITRVRISISTNGLFRVGSVTLQDDAAYKFISAFEFNEQAGGQRRHGDPWAHSLSFYEGEKLVHTFAYSKPDNELRSYDGLWEYEAKLTPCSKQQVNALLKGYGL